MVSREQAWLCASFGGSFIWGRRGVQVLERRGRYCVWTTTDIGGLARDFTRPLREKLKREYTPLRNIEDIGGAANQLLQMADREDQAAETHPKTQECGISRALSDEIRHGFLEMMKLMNAVFRPTGQRPQLPQGNLLVLLDISSGWRCEVRYRLPQATTTKGAWRLVE